MSFIRKTETEEGAKFPEYSVNREAGPRVTRKDTCLTAHHHCHGGSAGVVVEGALGSGPHQSVTEMRLRNGTFLTLLLFCLCAFLSLSWYAALSGQKGEPLPPPSASRVDPAPGRGRPGRVRPVAAGGGRKPTRAPLPSSPPLVCFPNNESPAWPGPRGRAAGGCPLRRSGPRDRPP